MKSIGSSFRDPAGFIFSRNGIYFRNIQNSYEENYNRLLSSGLKNDLVEKKLMVDFSDVSDDFKLDQDTYKVILPEQIPYISYPYEWCFQQLKDAALLTLQIQKIAINRGMSLKDASAYNVQFIDNRPVFIDSLSFEEYTEGSPWVAYRQFCQHFLAPILLARYIGIESLKLSQIFIDGIPLDFAAKQLPKILLFRPSILIHIFLHSFSQKSNSSKSNFKVKRISRNSQVGMIDNLINLLESVDLNNKKTEWGDYYSNTNYSVTASDNKLKIINHFISIAKTKLLFDIGGNNGYFLRHLDDKKIKKTLFDIDHNAISDSYCYSKETKEKNISSFILDLTAPSPAIGWLNNERQSFIDRASADTIMALALIHHLSISNNLPFSLVAKFFKRLSPKYLIIEFVPKSDSQVELLLKTRRDIFPYYDKDNFEKEFSQFFNILEKKAIEGSQRFLYLMKNNEK